VEVRALDLRLPRCGARKILSHAAASCFAGLSSDSICMERRLPHLVEAICRHRHSAEHHHQDDRDRSQPGENVSLKGGRAGEEKRGLRKRQTRYSQNAKADYKRRDSIPRVEDTWRIVYSRSGDPMSS
jgi:hypothetical protein